MGFSRCLVLVGLLIAGFAHAEGFDPSYGMQQPINHGMPSSFGQQFQQPGAAYPMQPYSPNMYQPAPQYNRCNVNPQNQYLQNGYGQSGMYGQSQYGFAQQQCRRPRRHRHYNGGSCGGGMGGQYGGQYGGQFPQQNYGQSGYYGDGGFSLSIGFGSGNVMSY